ncbi:hypothetical protein [Nocardia bovistercoris]|uniref:Uncharacterized protein n=1 Tax=Nocardia bovistercoris TaxID=2785916 RepID=A0A931I6J0_9NOCA|nr:hypothetical protein [Nocardia bovistercoris]MBH0774823.1 hypothetical protein [Nocardia bovistercoris]
MIDSSPAPSAKGELPVATLAAEIPTPSAGQVRAMTTVAVDPVLSVPSGHRTAAFSGLESR